MVVEESNPLDPERPGGRWVNRRQESYISWFMDVLIAVVILNLFVEFVDSVVIDSFTISVFTALVLKLLVDAIGGLEHRVSDWFKKHEGTAWKVGRILAVWGILFGSKFVILEVIDIIFGDSVELGGFLMIIAIIIALIVTRVVVFTIFRRLGDEGAA